MLNNWVNFWFSIMKQLWNLVQKNVHVKRLLRVHTVSLKREKIVFKDFSFDFLYPHVPLCSSNTNTFITQTSAHCRRKSYFRPPWQILRRKTRPISMLVMGRRLSHKYAFCTHFLRLCQCNFAPIANKRYPITPLSRKLDYPVYKSKKLIKFLLRGVILHHLLAMRPKLKCLVRLSIED